MLVFILIVILQYINETMGLTKSEIFTQEQNELAAIARVFAHPARVAILQHIFNTESCICGDLVEEIGLAQPTISQHLKELKNLGVIKGNIEGTSVCYCIDTEHWNRVKTTFMTLLDLDINSAPSCC